MDTREPAGTLTTPGATTAPMTCTRSGTGLGVGDDTLAAGVSTGVALTVSSS